MPSLASKSSCFASALVAPFALVAACTGASTMPTSPPLDAGPLVVTVTAPSVTTASVAPVTTLVASTIPMPVASATPSASCPTDMVLVEGEYCPEPVQRCLKWMDPEGPYEHFRCAQYAPSVCASPQRARERFCIDRDEYTPPGESLPAVHHSWTTASHTCASLGKRLCLESEWQFACEGEDMRPYPYGFERDSLACNVDRYNLGRPNAGLRDLRTPAGTHPACVSPFGVRDMSGNVEEWATLDHPWDSKDRSTMKGAWWLPGRNTCRAATTGHGEMYEGSQVGVRCCKDAGSSAQ
ncbi:MAG: SUMF1/EgtB/PvdO family nonheme iron enzyme [Polyangiales bacterium]